MAVRTATRTAPPFFHVGAAYVHAADGHSATRSASSYIRRLRECDVRARSAVVRAADYMRRQDQLAAARAEVVGHAWFSRGDATPESVWPRIDQAARTKEGRYHRRAGGVPRLAILAEFSLPWALPEETKIRLSHQIAEDIVAAYRCFVEVACHRKPDAPEHGIDHCHLLVSMREVDDQGRAGRMIRRFNGVASAKSEERVVIGDRALSGHIIWMRRRWAELLTLATGRPYEWRSYADAGVGLAPTPAYRRARIERETREGTRLWREERRAFLAKRAGMSTLRIPLASEEAPPPRPEGLAARLTSLDPRLRGLTSLRAVAILAVKTVANSSRPTIADTHERTETRTATRRDELSIADPPAINVAHVEHDRIETSSLHAQIAHGARAAPPQSESPAAQVSSLVARQWTATYEAERAAAMQRLEENLEARARSSSQITAPTPTPFFRILSEGDAEVPSRPKRLMKPAKPKVDTSAQYAITFGAALILSGWRTERGESALADACGMARSGFAAASQAKADELKAAKASPDKVRLSARDDAPAALLRLFDELEEERREAKRRAKKKPASSPALQDEEVGSAQAPPGSAPQRRETLSRPPTVPSPPGGPLPREPRTRFRVELLLRLAALLAWRGLLEEHTDEIARLTGLSRERVLDAARLELQALAQTRVRRGNLWRTTIEAVIADDNSEAVQLAGRVTRAASSPVRHTRARPDPKMPSRGKPPRG